MRKDLKAFSSCEANAVPVGVNGCDNDQSCSMKENESPAAVRMNWKNDLQSSPAKNRKLPHYMRPTAAFKAKQQSLVKEEKETKRKSTVSVRMDLRNNLQSSPTKNGELPHYMSLTAAYKAKQQSPVKVEEEETKKKRSTISVRMNQKNNL